MQTFFHLVRISFKQQLAYRMALWAGLATNLFFGLLRATLLIALYGNQTTVNGLSIGNAVTYVGLTQAMIAYLSLFGTFDLMNTIYSGAIGVDLLKPGSYFMLWMGRDFGKALVNLIGRGVIFMLLFCIFYPISLPQGFEYWLLLALALLLSFLISFSWRFLVNLSAFWTPDARGILRIAFMLSQFLSGFVMPLSLLPDWFVRLVQWTPFPSMVNTPVEIYLGTISTAQVWQALLLQLVWFGILALASHLVMRAGVRRLVIQGG